MVILCWSMVNTCAAIIKYGKPVLVTLRKTLTSEAGQVAMTYAFGHDTYLRRTFNDAMGAYNLADATGLTHSRRGLVFSRQAYQDGLH